MSFVFFRFPEAPEIYLCCYLNYDIKASSEIRTAEIRLSLIRLRLFMMSRRSHRKSRGVTLKQPKRFGPKRVQKRPEWHKKPNTTDFVSAAFPARARFFLCQARLMDLHNAKMKGEEALSIQPRV